jgi:hypothetical protein
MNLLMTISDEVLGKISIEVLEECIIKVYLHAKKAVIDYGTAVGIISAQSISEPMT